jgi:hypothetical protein
MSATYNPNSELPQELVLRLDIETDGHAHLYSVIPDEDAVQILREMADGLEKNGSRDPKDYTDGDAVPDDLTGDPYDLEKALKDLLGD